MSQREGRNYGIDTLRGIGILIVVMTHAGITGTVQREMLVFVLPLFYVAAGCFYKDFGTLRLLAADKLRRLIIPFAFYTAAGLAIYVAGNCLLLKQDFNYQLFNIFSTDRYYVPYPAALWFFPSIFWCYMLYGLTRKYTRNGTQLCIVCIGIGIAGWVMSRHLALPLSFDTSMSWLPFFHIGNLLATKNFGTGIMNGRYWLAGTVIATACCRIYTYAGYNTGYCFNIFQGDIMPMILLHLGATAGVMTVCCKIGKIPFITYIGRNSLVIFAGHQHFMIIVKQGLKHLHADLPNGVSNLILLVTSIGGALIAAMLLRKFAPQLIGEYTLHVAGNRSPQVALDK